MDEKTLQMDYKWRNIIGIIHFLDIYMKREQFSPKINVIENRLNCAVLTIKSCTTLFSKNSSGLKTMKKLYLIRPKYFYLQHEILEYILTFI